MNKVDELKLRLIKIVNHYNFRLGHCALLNIVVNNSSQRILKNKKLVNELLDFCKVINKLKPEITKEL